MRFFAGILTVLALSCVAGRAGAEEAPGDDRRPQTGVDRLAGGIALTAFGAISFATAAICETSVVIPTEQSACFTTSFLVGAPVLAAGVTLIVVGAVEHSRYNDWARRHPNLLGFSLAPTPHGSALGWSARF